MGRLDVLTLKKRIDGKGEYFDLMLNMEGSLTRCFIRTELGRSELLERLYYVSTTEELYSIDHKAVMYIA